MFLLWLKKWWKWVVAGLAILIAFIFGFLTRKPKFLNPSAEMVEEKNKVEVETKKKEDKAAIDRDIKIQEIEKQHKETIDKLNTEEQKNFEVLKDDPDALTGWLLDLGKKNRS